MRGLPGSGKSTYIKNTYAAEGPVVCSADDFFMTKIEDGGEIYDFDPRLLNAAHKDCMQRFLRAVNAAAPFVVVDNTGIRLWELSPYFQVASALGYDVEVVRISALAEVCAQRNVHGVPKAAVMRMADSFETALPWWGEKVVVAG